MDPFNSNAKGPMSPRPMSNNETPQGDPVHGHKKRMLQRLVHHALSSAAQGGTTVHDLAHRVKTAIGAYKNYSKEWDTLHGIDPKAQGDGSGGPGMMRPMPQQQPTRPQTPNLQMPQNRTPTPPISQQMVQPPRAPQQPLIAPAMPAFMGGGRPAGF